VLARCQDIKWIVNHSGAAVPTLAGRIRDRVTGGSSNVAGKYNDSPDRDKTPKTPNGVYHELKRLYFECAHATFAMPVAALRAFAPPTQYLFGTDFPIEPSESTVLHIPALKLPAAEQKAWDRGNAERLWPRLKS
jgi:predicted TIM-barrel fold metal-dependent hydrolase